MKIIIPLRIESKAVCFAAGDEAGIIQIAFGDQYKAAAEVRGERFDFECKVLEEVGGRIIKKRVNGIEPQSIEMVMSQPHERVIRKKASNFVAVLVIEIYSGSPGSAIFLDEIWSEPIEVIAYRPEVVVNNIEQNREAFCMAGIYKGLEIVRRAVAVMRRIQIDAVVAPTPRA